MLSFVRKDAPHYSEFTEHDHLLDNQNIFIYLMFCPYIIEVFLKISRVLVYKQEGCLPSVNVL